LRLSARILRARGAALEARPELSQSNEFKAFARLTSEIPATESLDNSSPMANRLGRYCDPHDRQEKAPASTSLAATGAGAGTIGEEASGWVTNSAVLPFSAIGQIAAGIVLRLAQGGAA
jgi:hypothetical protein